MEKKQVRKIRFEIIKYVLDNCEKLNVQRPVLLENSGLDENILKSDHLYISLEHFEKIVLYLDGLYKDNLFLLEVFLKNESPSISVLGLLMSVSGTLGEAIITACKYREINGDVGDRMIVREDGDQIYLIFFSCFDDSPYTNLILEFRCAWWVSFIKKYCDNGKDYINYVFFEHSLSSVKKKGYDEFFGCPVYFNMNESVLSISKEALSLPFKSENRELFVNIENYIISLLDLYKGESFILDEVKKNISNQLRRGGVSREIIAEQLGLNVRTLTRKLNAAGTTYSNLLEEVRLETAIIYLNDSDMKVSIISKKIGFFSSNAFITWFKGLTGKTPKQYRDLKSK
ncbi:AraC family transcriptional regulator [Acinetobacter gyllenbergii]|uniref:AraC family transcriptional regulator n=1 Tax=Acinetobacter gyllenbergii TaxID=134534 RepID=UPI0021D01E38|nr:AraC family transcriptional regulator [Acinetobacter gyllenbergii]MCU4582505.1 AraC family transcriptional regulator [Acinetobacter gyllenbergii]